MSGSTWIWNGGTGQATTSANWTPIAGPGNAFGYPQAGDTAIIAGGTVLTALDSQFSSNIIELGGTVGVAALSTTGDSGVNFANPTFTSTTILSSAVPGSSTAESSALDAAGVVVNAGTILADGPAGSSFTIAISGTTVNGTLEPGYVFNAGVIQADAGNTLTIIVGGTSALFNTGSIVADGGTVLVTSATSALAGGFMPVRGFYDIEGGGTIITADDFPASDTGSNDEYEFADSTPGNTLKIENIASFGGVIFAFSAGDTIDLGTLLAVGTIAYSESTNLLSLEAANGTTLASLIIGPSGTGIADGSFAVVDGSADGFSLGVGADGDTVLTTGNTLIETSGTSGAWQSATTWQNGVIPGTTAAPGIGFGASAPFTITTGDTPVSVEGFGVLSAFATVQITSDTTLINHVSDFAGTVDIASGNTLIAGAIQVYTQQSSFTLAAGATAELAGRLDLDLAPVGGVWSLQPGQNPYAFVVSGGTAVIDGALLAGPAASTRGGGVSIGYDSNGDATVFVNPGATVTALHTTIGSDPTSSGTLVISGATYTDIIDNADTYNSRGNMTVGYDDLDLNLPSDVTAPPPEGSAQLVIENNATVTDARAFIAENEESAGTVTVSSGGVWNLGLATGGYLAAADGGQGALFIESGGTVNVGNVGTFLNNGTPSTGGGIGLGYTGGSGTIVVSGAGALLTTEDGIAVGRGGQALLEIQNGGTVQDTGGGLTVGAVAAAGASGTLIVGGAGTSAALNFSAASGTIAPASGLTVGASSTGTLVVADNGVINLNGTGYLTVGSGAGVFGDMIVGGTTASAVVNIGTTSLTVGYNGTAEVTVNSLGTINEYGTLGAGIEIGQDPGSSGTLTVNGGEVIGSAASNGLYMGLSGGTGVLTIENGGTVSLAGGGVGIAQAASANDTITVQGTGSEFLMGGSYGITVGQGGNGALAVTGGGAVEVTAGAVDIGQNPSATGTVVVSGAGSSITTFGTSGVVSVGDSGTGMLTVSNGGSVATSAGLFIAGSGTTIGTVAVSGSGSSITAQGANSGIGVGTSGTGSLDINSGGWVDANFVAMGYNGATGIVSVESGGTLINGNLDIGYTGVGSLVVASGGTVVTDAGDVQVGQNAGAAGDVVVTGDGSSITTLGTSGIAVGELGAGTLAVTDGGSVATSADLFISSGSSSSSGTVSVSGSGASITALGTNGVIGVGVSGTGYLDINSDGLVNAGTNGIVIGYSGATGIVSVDSGGTLNVGNVSVGLGGTGSLAVTSGGAVEVTAGAVNIGQSPSGTGTVVVSGAGSSITTLGTSGIISVGDFGTGVLTITNGGSVSTSADLFISGSGTTSSTVSVSGTGSSITALGTNGIIGIGVSGTGSLDINSDGLVNAGTNGIAIGYSGAAGIVSVESGGALLGGSLSIGIGGTALVSIGAGGTVAVTGVTVGQNGSLVMAGGLLDPDFVTLNGGGSVSGYGTLEADVDNASTMTASGGTLDVTGSITGSGTLVVSSDGDLMLDAGIASEQHIDFLDNAGRLTVGDIGGFTATIGAFQAGDTIFVSTPGAATFSQSGAMIEVISGGTTLGVLDFSSTGLATTAIGTSGALVDIPCFAAGTRIRTTRGEVAVEALREGDVAITGIDGSAALVVWIGHREVDCKRHPDPKSVWPVRIKAGAFGSGLPKRALTLSPDHAVYVNEVLVPVKHVINGTTIAQMRVDRVTYYHVELPQHDVLLAEGLPAESYLDVGDRANFANGGAVVRLHIDLAHHWEANGCAPLVVYGPELEAVRALVAAQENVLGNRMPRARARRGARRRPGDRGHLGSIGTGGSAGPVPAMCLEARHPARSVS